MIPPYAKRTFASMQILTPEPHIAPDKRSNRNKRTHPSHRSHMLDTPCDHTHIYITERNRGISAIYTINPNPPLTYRQFIELCQQIARLHNAMRAEGTQHPEHA